MVGIAPYRTYSRVTVHAQLLGANCTTAMSGYVTIAYLDQQAAVVRPLRRAAADPAALFRVFCLQVATAFTKDSTGQLRNSQRR